MKFTISFSGRKKDALGITYSIIDTVEAESFEQAVLSLYDRYEHVSDPKQIENFKEIITITLNGSDPLFAFPKKENQDFTALEAQIREFATKNSIVGRVRFHVCPLFEENNFLSLSDGSLFSFEDNCVWMFNV